MEILKFNLSGKTAFFKKPEVNTYLYFTYGHIHKVAILGILGSILGYDGYSQMREEDVFPEFYDKLNRLEVSIVPGKKSAKGVWSKKVQNFNNSAGYASQEKGGNLIVRQEWLEDPDWDIYIKVNNPEAEKIKNAILNHNTVYIPYLGSNDHMADIYGAELAEGTEITDAEGVRIDSFFPADQVELSTESSGTAYHYAEFLPVGLTEEANEYILKQLIYTNLLAVESVLPLYRSGEKVLAFI